eukprot:750256-Hanusia_phi.AAC.2
MQASKQTTRKGDRERGERKEWEGRGEGGRVSFAALNRSIHSRSLTFGAAPCVPSCIICCGAF